VPRAARAGRWWANVTCSGEGSSQTRQPITLQGPSGGVASIIQPSSLRITPYASDRYDGGKGGGSDCSPGRINPASGYCTGYCTEYVWKLLPDFARLGNASQWWDNPRVRRGRVPRVASVAWWGSSRPNRPYGHVAYVSQVGGGAIIVREMNHAGHWNVADVRTIDLSSQEAPDGYLYGAEPVTQTEETGDSGAQTYLYPNYPNYKSDRLAPSTSVQVECRLLLRDKRTNAGRYWYRIYAPRYGTTWARAEEFLNGGTSTGPSVSVDTSLPRCLRGSRPPRARAVTGTIGPPVEDLTSRVEMAAHFGARTFARSAGILRRGPVIEPYASVIVACYLYDARSIRLDSNGFLYRIASAPWHGDFYAPASSFLNGAPPGGPFTRSLDYLLPPC
jgi:surface antigen